MKTFDLAKWINRVQVAATVVLFAGSLVAAACGASYLVVGSLGLAAFANSLMCD